MAYEWMQGVSQCWPPGTKCEVWWDAWAVVVAALSLCVALLTTVVTAGSAVAVFMLGRAANRLAGASESREEELRKREARVLAGFLQAELRHTALAAAVVLETLQEFGKKDYVSSRERSALRLQLEAEQMPLSASVMSRLHVLPTSACDSITGAISNMSLALKAAHGFEEPNGEIGDDLYRQIIELRVQSAADALTVALTELSSILGRNS
ncbi:hypothetical protein [Stenotrophomonas sp. SORGH_AS_0321]|uniref:hypothetical protein n=1 Tax=Stenotrophomonas sp. SORGH_AS_0321 TaxID=3041787 RepID=UPI00285DB49B|nr:hypothetical protein [Stenotrophomonas sp. SORGH_AS_0321]MDR6094941.1 hypothetical protein [Stenotrophomonas sp. SORGH_AS_0321]